MDISVVIPVYGCKAALPELHRRLTETLSDLIKEYEIILVDDRCPQDSWSVIKMICESDKRVIGIRLSRNFGQIRAITAGLDNSKGEYVVVMDCDLQDRPESIKDLYIKALEGYDIVIAKRVRRKDSMITKCLSRMYYQVYNLFTEDNYDPDLCNFSIANRKVIDTYCSMREQARDYPMFLKWMGYNETEIPLEGDSRYEGKSSYTLSKKINMALEVISTMSNKPLLISIKIGFFLTLVSFIYITFLVVQYFLVDDMEMGWTSTVASIYLVAGLLLCALGVVGLYVGNIFKETKRRPLYIVQDIMRKENDHMTYEDNNI